MSKVKCQMSKIFLIALCALLFAPNAFSQFNFISTSVDTISANDSTYKVDTKGYKLAALILPATVTATKFTILTSATNVDSMFKVVEYDGAEVEITASDGKQCGVAPVKVNQQLRCPVF